MIISKKSLALIVAIVLFITGISTIMASAEDDSMPIAQFSYDNTEKVSKTDLVEYANAENDYEYLSTKGTATLTGSINGTNDKHLSWSKDVYNDTDGNAIGIVPVFGASTTNNWTSDAYIAVSFSTAGYNTVEFAMTVGATKKGPANYTVSVTDGKTTEDLGSFTISKNKTMTPVKVEVPDTMSDAKDVTVYIKLANTATVGGSDVSADPTGGEIAINDIIVTGVKINTSTPDESTPDDATPDEATPGEATPGEATPGEATPGEATPGEATPGEVKPGLIGDTNLDNSIDIVDATYIQRYLAKLKTFDKQQLANADADGDNEVTIVDATVIQRYLAKLINKLG